jgi:hypothetical protein
MEDDVLSISLLSSMCKGSYSLLGVPIPTNESDESAANDSIGRRLLLNGIGESFCFSYYHHRFVYQPTMIIEINTIYFHHRGQKPAMVGTPLELTVMS